MCGRGGGWELGETRLITIMRRCCLLFELVGAQTQQKDGGDRGGRSRRKWAVKDEENGFLDVLFIFKYFLVE